MGRERAVRHAESEEGGVSMFSLSFSDGILSLGYLYPGESREGNFYRSSLEDSESYMNYQRIGGLNTVTGAMD